MSRHVVSGIFLAAVMVLSAPLAAASVPDPPHSSVSWAGPFNGACTFPVICPKGDVVATINVTVKDQFGAPMAGIAANEVEATGSCLLGGGSPCAQVISVIANGPTNASGFTTITISKAGGCCTDLQVRARSITLNTLSYRSYDYTADLKCDLSDLGFLADTFNKSSGNTGYNACFDFNCDNKVDLADLGFFADHFNHVCT
jgi:hypothetical protein